AARQQRVVFARANERGRIPERIGGTGAAAGEDVADAVHAERDRDLARHHAADADGDRVRRHVAAAGREEIFVLALADIDAAAAAADEDAGIRLAGAQAGVAPRFARR